MLASRCARVLVLTACSACGLPAAELSRWQLDGALTDSGPAGNDGIFSGTGPTYTTGHDGSPSAALALDGSQYVEASRNTGLPLYGHAAFTVAMWVRGLPQTDRGVWAESSRVSATPLYSLGTDVGGATGKLDFFHRSDAGQTVADHILSTQEPFDGAWHHLAWVDDGGAVALYVDGVRDASDFSYARTTATFDAAAMGAVLRASPCCHFEGEIDAVRIFDHALDAGEIAELLSTDGPLSQRLVRSGASWRYFKGTSEPSTDGGGAPSLDWTLRPFNDSAWTTGTLPIGFGEPGIATTLSDMLGSYVSLYCRKPFSLASLDGVESLELRVKFDDGFIAYLNGNEVARQGLTPPIPERTELALSHEPTHFESFEVSPALLQLGSNTLAIQVHNNALASADFYLDLELVVPAEQGALTSSQLDTWIPAGEFASRNPDIGAVITPGDASISNVVLKVDGVSQTGVTQTPGAGSLRIVKAAAGPYEAGTAHTVQLSYTDSVSGARTFTRDFQAALLVEDFDALELGPNVDVALAADRAFTHTPPPGWAIDNSQMQAAVNDPATGMEEWEGWSFADPVWWVAAALDQRRSEFTRASGNVAVADPDEWDDKGDTGALSYFNSFLRAPQIDIAGVAADSIVLTFDSSWRPEAFDDAGPDGQLSNNQTAIVAVSYDGGAPLEALHWDSDGRGPRFKPASTNETVSIPLSNPEGASSLRLSFALLNAGNDWWWAVDNIVVTVASVPSFRRGDANSDGRVSIADVRALALRLAGEGPAPLCLEAFDANDSGALDPGDVSLLLDGLFVGAPISAPYPLRGLDPTPDALGCEGYGTGAPLDDPTARLRLLDAYVVSGSDTHVSLTIAATSATAVAGFSAEIPIGFPITGILGVEVLAQELAGARETATYEAGSLRVACHHCSLGPGGPTPLLRIDAAIPPDLAPGDHAMTFSSGELVDAATGRAILPGLRGGALHAAASSCDGELSVASISSGSSANGQGATLSGRIIGSGFGASTRFRLDGPVSIPASEALVVSSCNAEVVFDMEDAPADIYDLVAAQAGGESATLAGAVTVATAVLGPVVDAWLTSPERVRHDRLFTAILHCRNRGDGETLAPFVRLRAPQGFELAVEAEGIFQGNELLVLAGDAKGVAGILPPGVEVEVPILLRPALARCPPDAAVGETGCDPFPSAACTACAMRLEVAVLSEDEGDFVGWDLLAEASGEAWAARWRDLASILGGSWRDVHASLASIATRLSRRGEPAASVRRLFRFAVREALGLPGAAALGQVTDGAGRLLAGVDVHAIDGQRVASSARTDRFGTFALDWLTAGRSYRVAVGPEPGAGATFSVPAQDDLVNLRLVGTPDGSGGTLECANCDESGLPDRPLPIPDALFTPRAESKVSVLSAWDPNDKEGPEGDGGLLRARSWIEYRIDFENQPSASLPARQVIIEDELDEQILDLSTLQVTDIQIGDRPEQAWGYELDGGNRYSGYTSTAVVGASSAQRQLQILQQPAGQEEVAIEVSYSRLLDTSDPLRPKLVIVFGTLADDPLQGFLLPNDPQALRQGEGHITFAVQLKAEADIPDDSDELRNKASLLFDSLQPIETRTWVNGIARGAPPLRPRFPVPGAGAVLFSSAAGALLQWEDLGAASYELRLWETGKQPPSNGIVLDESFYSTDPGTLEPGRSYTWEVVALGADGSRVSSGPWTFSVPQATLPPPPPLGPEPADGALGVSLPLALDWNDVPGAAAYAVTLLGPTGASRSYPGLSRSELTGISDLAPGALHTWWVDAFASGGDSTRSSEWHFTTAGEPARRFLRGDSNNDGRSDISDAIAILGFLFLGAPTRLDCEKSADVNDNGSLDISDGIFLLTYKFLGGSPPPPPFSACDFDATPDELPCTAFSACP